jgi:hypothetical protein
MRRKSSSPRRLTIISLCPEKHQALVFRLGQNGKLTEETFDFYGFDGNSDRNDFVLPQVGRTVPPRTDTEGGLWLSLFKETPHSGSIDQFLSVISNRKPLESVVSSGKDE